MSLILASLAVFITGATEDGEQAMTDGRVLHKQVVVAAPIREVWKAWTTEEGLAFVSGKSNVRLEIGGPYEWFLDLDADEHGLRGGEGAVIHAFLPPEMLAFSWTFPPSIPSLRSARETTQVVVRFREVAEGTQVDFRQFGWRDGEDWDRGYEYFDNAWDLVLGRLVAHFAGGTVPAGVSAEEGRAALAAAVEARELAFAASVAERDLDAFRSFLHPDAVFLGGAEPLRGADRVVEGWRQFFEPDSLPLVWAPDRVEVRDTEDLAISTGPYWFESVDDEGEARRVGGRFFSVWQRGADGVWRVLFDAGTDARPLN